MYSKMFEKMIGSGGSSNTIGSNNNNNIDKQQKTLTLTCNLDSIDSIKKFVNTVYRTLTPRCYSSSGKIRKYGSQKMRNQVFLFTIPKSLFLFLFGSEAAKFGNPINNVQIDYFFDKNSLKHFNENNGKEEYFILMKITKNSENVDNGQ